MKDKVREELRNTGCVSSAHVNSMSVLSSAFRSVNAMSMGINRAICSGRTVAYAAEREET